MGVVGCSVYISLVPDPGFYRYARRGVSRETTGVGYFGACFQRLERVRVFGELTLVGYGRFCDTCFENFCVLRAASAGNVFTGDGDV